MLQSRRLAIRSLAEQLFNEFSLTVPVDVDTLVRELGGTVVETRHPTGAEAYVKKVGEQSFEIGIAPSLVPTRRRFSVAHELGHLFVHMGFLVDDARWQRFNEYVDNPMFRMGHSEEEYEAHEFAGSLLMPSALFKEVAIAHRQVEPNGSSVYVIEPIAAHFGVSPEAVRMRGRWLKLFSWD